MLKLTFQKSRWLIWGEVLLLLALLGLLMTIFAQPVYATDFRGGETVVIGADEVIDDDLFVAGQAVIVNGTVKGNLFATGSTVTVNGHVEGSLFMAAQELIGNGRVDGSAYVGGYGFTLGPEASIGRNLSFGGFGMTTEEGSHIGRSLYAGAYQLIHNGEVTNDINIGAAALELNGVVGGDVLGEVDSSVENESVYIPTTSGISRVVSPGLHVNERANISGDVGVVVNAAPIEPENTNPVMSFFNRHIRWVLGQFITLLIVGSLFLWLWPSGVERSSAEVQSHWLPDLGAGLLTTFSVAIGLPIVLVLLILIAVLAGWLTLGQLGGHIVAVGLTSIGLAVAAFIFVAALLTKVIVAYAGGRLILTRFTSTMKEGTLPNFAALSVGLLIYMLLRAIPFGLGWAIGLLTTLVGLGALYFVFRGRVSPSVNMSTPVVGTPTEVPA